MPRLIATISFLVICFSALPSELQNLSAQDQNIELDKDKTEADLDDNSDLNLKFFQPPLSPDANSVVLFSGENQNNIASLFFEEVPTPPPLSI